jgi:hypothetical protein
MSRHHKVGSIPFSAQACGGTGSHTPVRAAHAAYQDTERGSQLERAYRILVSLETQFVLVAFSSCNHAHTPARGWPRSRHFDGGLHTSIQSKNAIDTILAVQMLRVNVPEQEPFYARALGRQEKRQFANQLETMMPRASPCLPTSQILPGHPDLHTAHVSVDSNRSP